jgi:Flp pilus assembly protein TadG
VRTVGRHALAYDRCGAVSVEVALLLPLLIALLGGGLEAVDFVLVNQKLDRTAASLSDLVARTSTMTEGEMKSMFSAVSFIMQPFDLLAGGNVIVSSISAAGGVGPKVAWQRSTGLGNNTSQLGKEGAAATLPSGLTVRDGDNIIVCETYFYYHPMFFKGVFTDATLYRYAVFHPRFGKLDVIYP